MNRYKIVVAYDGTDFYGWQVQPSVVTIASVLQKSFYRLFSREIVITGASRTDAGVHALGQVATFVTDLNIDTEQIRVAWNNGLPDSILIRSLERVDSKFHIFSDVLNKTYYYHLFYKHPLPFAVRYGWYWKFIDDVDFDIFYRAMKCFVGEHDFRSFCKNEKDKPTVRVIDAISMKKFDRFSAFRIELKGKGFLRYQIRRMLGAALDVAKSKRLSVDFIKEQLKNPCDQQQFTRAEGRGLCLRKIVYKKVPNNE